MIYLHGRRRRDELIAEPRAAIPVSPVPAQGAEVDATGALRLLRLGIDADGRLPSSVYYRQMRPTTATIATHGIAKMANYHRSARSHTAQTCRRDRPISQIWCGE